MTIANDFALWLVIAVLLMVIAGGAAWIMWLCRRRDDLVRELGGLQARADRRRRERRALQSVIEREAHGILNFDEEGTIAYANGTAETLFGYNKDDMIGASFRKLIDERTLTEHGIDIPQFQFPKDRSRFDIEGYRADGSTICLDAAFTEFEAPNGTLLVAFLWDTTERRQEKQRLLQALHSAEVANRIKSAFLANVSHEVRTPMTAIIGMAELCLRTELDDTQHDYLTKLHDTSRSLLGILNDILDFSKIEAGELKLEHIAFPIDQVLDEVATVMRQRAFQQGLELIFSRDADVPDELIGDPMRLKQVLINLCTNAVKFTEYGQVELNITSRRTEAGRKTLAFSVRDTGIGMTEQQVAGLFKPFSQADSSTSRKYGGTGLGLSISQHLVQMMGGEINVKSKPGRGSVFSFSASFEIDDSSDLGSLASRLAGDAFKGMTALVVDDSRRACEVITSCLNSFGFDAEFCTTRQDGINKVLERVDAYDLILFDEEMPGDISGDRCLELVGRDRISASRLILMAENRGEPDEDIRGAAVVSKPASPSRLMEAVMEQFGYGGERRRRKVDSDLTVDQSLAGARVLLVEDNDINQQVAKELLCQAGLRVDIANNGVEALVAIERNPYDCVLMDIQMPEMDGYEATRRLRQREKFKDLPVLAMTANALMDARAQMLAAGMNDHISKPIDARQLLDAIRRAVTHDDGTNGNTGTGDVEVVADAGNVLDRKSGIRYVNGNGPLYDSLVKEFARDNRDDADSLLTFIEAGDVQGAKRVVHTLKGLTRTIGANACYQQVRSIDELLGHGFTPDRIMIGELRDCLHELCDAIEKEGKRGRPVLQAKASPGDFEGLRRLIVEMDPAAESRLEEMLPSIHCSDKRVVVRLAEEVKNYEFDKALRSLDEVRRLMV